MIVPQLLTPKDEAVVRAFREARLGESGHERAEFAIRHMLDGDGERTLSLEKLT